MSYQGWFVGYWCYPTATGNFDAVRTAGTPVTRKWFAQLWYTCGCVRMWNKTNDTSFFVHSCSSSFFWSFKYPIKSSNKSSSPWKNWKLLHVQVHFPKLLCNFLPHSSSLIVFKCIMRVCISLWFYIKWVLLCFIETVVLKLFPLSRGSKQFNLRTRLIIWNKNLHIITKTIH